MSQSSTPNDQDLVLGGQLPPPINGAVLGGLAGLEHRFTQADLAQKLAALAEAATYGEMAIPLLQRALDDANLPVRATAYHSLKSLQPNKPELARGIPLRVGDHIYGVYRSSVSYGDDWYYIDADLSEWYQEDYPLYKGNPAKESFSYISDLSSDNQMHPSDAYELPNLVAYCTDQNTAAAKAETVYLEKFQQLDCNIAEVYSDHEPEGFDLTTWVETNQVVVENVLEDWGDSDWAFRSRVLTSLYNQKRFDWLREIWEPLGYRPLAFVYEHIIDRPCYLRLKTLEASSCV